jgi:hypothetical protein
VCVVCSFHFQAEAAAKADKQRSRAQVQRRAVRAQRRAVLAAHQAFRAEQQQGLHDALLRFKFALLPLPPDAFEKQS